MTINHPWLNSYPAEVNWDAPFSAEPLFALMDEALRRWPERQAVDFLGFAMTYRELAAAVDKAAKGFQSIGVKKGVQVGLFLPNCPQFIISYYGILKAGGTVVNFSPLYSLPQLVHQVEDSHTSIMVTLDLESLYPKAAELLEKSSLQKVVVSRFASVLPVVTRCLFQLFKRKEMAKVAWRNERHVSFEALLANDGQYVPVAIKAEDDIAVLQYTGGTTGTPKGAMLTHANAYINAQQTAMWVDPKIESGAERMLGVLPFFHVFAMTTVMNLSLARGMTIIMHPRFELQKVLDAIVKKKPTLLPGVPTMYNAILNHPNIADYDLSSLKVCVSGGAPLPLDVKNQFEAKTGCKLVEGYGLTEASPVCAANPVVGENKSGTIGLPFPATVFEIVDMTSGEVLPLGEIGELCIRGPQVMKGYFEKPESTDECLKDGRLHTGDLGFIDEQGYVTIVDRAKEMVICGGFNVYPRNVEEALYLHPAVMEAAVIGVADGEKGQHVKAFIVCRKGASVTVDELRGFCREHLAKYAVPAEIEFRDELPKSMIGKVLKKDLV